MKRATDRLFERRRRGGFTLTEILIVIVIIGLLAALLLPAIGAAIARARDATVSAEINQMAQALADFKSRYGDYPPSRILLMENGDYSIATSNTPTYNFTGSAGDISDQALAQRSLRFLRKFFPRVLLSTTPNSPVWPLGSSQWYDFNGTGTFETTGYVLSGHECLVWFLGGIPSQSQDSNGRIVYGVTGFSKSPTNPFTAGGTNRQPSLFEFAGGRLFDNDGDHVPSYQDTLGQNFYAYFSAYGNNSYDPNDDNVTHAGVFPLSEMDDNGGSPTLNYLVNFPVQGGTIATSPPPNPYTTSLTNSGISAQGNPITINTVNYLSPQSFQIISAGRDQVFGIGGSYSESAAVPLPIDTANTKSTDPSIRFREKDNLTNFHNGKLE